MSLLGLKTLFSAAIAAAWLACAVAAPAAAASAERALAQNESPPLPRNRPLAKPPIKPGKTAVMEFETAPFPFDGTVPSTGKPFFDVFYDGRFGRRGARGHVYWENETYSDSRVLLHVPDGFDVRKPAVIVVFFHGHGATIQRDIRNRQGLPAQISLSGANAVLVAPQFALDAADSSPGAFWEPGVFAEFLSEAGEQLSLMIGNPKSARTFFKMPVVIIGYSGGYLPTAWAMAAGGVKERVRGIVLLDALYGEVDKFEDWIAKKSGFFVSGYLGSTRSRNLELQRDLGERKIHFDMELSGDLKPGSVVFLPGSGEESHRDYVTHAWTSDPVADILSRLPEFKR